MSRGISSAVDLVSTFRQMSASRDAQNSSLDRHPTSSSTARSLSIGGGGASSPSLSPNGGDASLPTRWTTLFAPSTQWNSPLGGVGHERTITIGGGRRSGSGDGGGASRSTSPLMYRSPILGATTTSASTPPLTHNLGAPSSSRPKHNNIIYGTSTEFSNSAASAVVAHRSISPTMAGAALSSFTGQTAHIRSTTLQHGATATNRSSTNIYNYNSNHAVDHNYNNSNVAPPPASSWTQSRHVSAPPAAQQTYVQRQALLSQQVPPPQGPLVRWTTSSATTTRQNSSGVTEFVDDDDAFDRDHVDLTPSRTSPPNQGSQPAATPRVFSPPANGNDAILPQQPASGGDGASSSSGRSGLPSGSTVYLIPQPQVLELDEDIPGGAFASLRDDFLRGSHMQHYHKQQTIQQQHSLGRGALVTAASPPPRLPPGAITSPTSSQPSYPAAAAHASVSRSRQSSLPPQQPQEQYPPLYDSISSRTLTPAKENHRNPNSLSRPHSSDSLDDAIEHGLSRAASNVTAATAQGYRNHSSSRHSSLPPGGGAEGSAFHGALMDFHGIAIPVPSALVGGGGGNGGDGSSSVAASHSVSRSPAAQPLPFQQQRPSRFLLAVVEAVALRKRARLVPNIPLNVILAFDSVVRDGAYFVKYTTGSAPHERFFQIRFVDVQGRAPEPCLSWSVHRTSWSAKGVLNLAAIRSVTRGVGTKAFRRQQVDTRRIRGPMIGGPHRAVLPITHAFWVGLHDGGTASGEDVDETLGSDPLSLLSLNSEVFDAWMTFLQFVIAIGTTATEGDERDDIMGTPFDEDASSRGTPHSMQ